MRDAGGDFRHGAQAFHFGDLRGEFLDRCDVADQGRKANGISIRATEDGAGQVDGQASPVLGDPLRFVSAHQAQFCSGRDFFQFFPLDGSWNQE